MKFRSKLTGVRAWRPFRSKLFVRLMLSYIAVIAISLLVYFCMYNYASNKIYKLVLTSGQEAQINAGIQIDSMFSEIDTLLVQMSNDSSITGFNPVDNQLDSNEYLSLYKLQHALQRYIQTNSNIENLILYYPESDVVCSNRIASARAKNAYSVDYGYVSFGYEQWKRQQEEVRYASVWPAMRLTNEKRPEVVSYVKRFPVNHLGRNRAIVTVQIRAERLNKLLHTSMLAQGTASCIYNGADGSTIYSCECPGTDPIWPKDVRNMQGTGEEARFSDRKRVVFNTPLKAGNLVCLTAFDLNTLMSDSSRDREILIGILLLALLLELLYAFVASRWSYRPIRDIMNVLPDARPMHGDDEYAAIRSSISRMNDESEEIRMRLSDQQQTIRELCLGRLLGLEPGLDNFDSIQSGVPASCKAHLVFVVYFSSRDVQTNGVPSAREDIGALRLRLAQKHVAESVICMDYFTNSSAFILSDRDMESIRASMSALTEILEERISEDRPSLYVGIGLPTDNLKQISRSFSEARLAAQEARLLNRHVILYEDVESRQETYDYSAEMELSLEKNMIAGNFEKAIGIINNVYWKVRESSVSANRLQLLLNEIYGTLLKVRQQNHLPKPVAEREFYLLLNEIEFNTNLYQRYMSILQAVRYYCEQVSQSQTASTPSLCQRVTEYIDKNYTDSNLCLDSIAEEFGVSSKYLSRHFKEQTNCQISTFITNTRMKQACLLLKDKKINISEMAGMCGYANTNTFYKAFKRYWGMSPGAFRGSMDDRKGEWNDGSQV